MEEFRTCEYCKQTVTKEGYWKHIQEVHPKKFEKDGSSLIQLYNDYLNLGMNIETVVQVMDSTYNVDIQKIIEKKDLRSNRWAILFFFGSYGLFYAIAIIYHYMLVLPGVPFTFQIAELNRTVGFTMPLPELLDVILLGFGFSLNAFWAFELIPNNPHKTSKAFKVFFMLGIIIVNYGVIAHMLANFFDEYIYALKLDGLIIESGSLFEEFELGIYFWDEIVSHLISAIGIYLLTLTLMILEAKGNMKSPYSGGFVRFLCILIGFGIAFGFTEGQTAFVFFFASVVYIIIALIIIVVRKGGFARSPFNTATIFVMLGYIIFIIIYVMYYGLKPDYPFIFQPTEMGIGI